MTPDTKIMHADLVDFFATHEQLTAAHKTTAHAQISATMDIAHDGQRHVMTLEHQLRKALTAPHDHGIDHNLNYLKTRIRSTSEAYKALLQAAEEVAARLVELEDGFSESTRGINNLAALSIAVPGTTTVQGEPTHV